MSLTPPPPPPPHRPTSMGGSGCRTPKLVLARRLSGLATSSGPGSPGGRPAPSPTQLREILADITKQVTNSPGGLVRTTTGALRRQLTGGILGRDGGPVTRSRALMHQSRRSTGSGTPRSSRATTPLDENEATRTPLRTPSTSRPPTLPRATPLTAGSSTSASSFHGPTPPALNEQERRLPIAPLRYRALSTVSSLAASPTTTTMTTSTSASTSVSASTTTSASEPRTPAVVSERPPALRLRPIANASSSPIRSFHHFQNQSATTPTTRERPTSDILDSPQLDHSRGAAGSMSKRRRRNNSGLGRL